MSHEFPLLTKVFFSTDIQKYQFLRNLDCSGTKMFYLQGRKTFHGDSWNAEVKMQDEDIGKNLSFKQGALWSCIEVFVPFATFSFKLLYRILRIKVILHIHKRSNLLLLDLIKL